VRENVWHGEIVTVVPARQVVVNAVGREVGDVVVADFGERGAGDGGDEAKGNQLPPEHGGVRGGVGRGGREKIEERGEELFNVAVGDVACCDFGT